MTPAPAAGPGSGVGGPEGGPDAELERLKARRLAEMRERAKRLEAAKGEKGEAGAKAAAPARRSPREALVSSLGHRGLEVLEAAERQYPAQAPPVVDELGWMVMHGQLPGGLDGGGLLYVFRSVGINVRLNTKISVEQDGRMVSISDRLSRSGGRGGGAASGE